jgi:hypothetical protein
MTPAAVQDPWKEVSAARLTLAHAHLAALAPVRDRGEVRVTLVGDFVWVRWPPGQADVVRCLLPVPGVEFFTHRDGLWFGFGSRLPSDVTAPSDGGRPVSAVLFPAKFEPTLPAVESGSPVRLGLVRGGEPHAATALACPLLDLAKWADGATTAELAAVRAARSGGHTVLLGSRLPPIASGTRFWGTDLVVPIGFRPDPDLPPTALRTAVGADDGEIVLLDHDGANLIPKAAFEPLTRAGLRLAVREIEAGAEHP